MPAAAGAVASGGGLADRLKTETREAHTRAERHPVQANLIRGIMSREAYAAYLWQLRHVWAALDGALRREALRDPRVDAMLKPYHEHTPRVDADLRFYESVGAAAPAAARAPSEATKRFVNLVESSAQAGCPVLGIWYVLEGSANGGRFIAASLAKAYGLTDGRGLATLDPHGELQRERWQAWRSELGRQTFTPAEQDAVVAAASATFDAMYELMEDLVAARVV
ncbi:MAG: biliverdin-producing heme oxygenase [Planctomycetota bacterium]|nr:biliverdin-producing heme oxygenase [Planctomycetota bacterium]